MPAGPDEARFFGAILSELGSPLMPSAQVCRRQEAAVRLLRETSVRLVVIDEVHNLLSGSPLQQRRMLNLLRWLGNELQIPLVAVGTAEALRAIQSDDQLANRFEPLGCRLGEMARSIGSSWARSRRCCRYVVLHTWQSPHWPRRFCPLRKASWAKWSRS